MRKFSINGVFQLINKVEEGKEWDYLIDKTHKKVLDTFLPIYETIRRNVNRKNVEGKHLYYWLRQAGIIIIDYGYEDGDIHIYKHLESTEAENLKAVLDKYAGNTKINSTSYLEFKELKDADSLFNEIFTHQSR